MQKKLFLLDAFALIFRAYYALIKSPRITSTGKNTNAQFGFTNTLLELIQKEKPTHLAVCFDMEGPTERHTDFADYKANRQETPEDILQAVPDIKRIIEGFNIPVIGVSGYEADDVIGTLAWQAHDAGFDVYMVTPDKDYGQLVRDGVYMYKPGYQGGSFEILGPTEVCSKWDIEHVGQVVDMLGLMGDAVDNIPGIKGIGEKTAAKLLKEYGSLEEILAHADDIKGSVGEKIRAGKESAIMSKKLATIITQSPITFNEQLFELKAWDKEALKSIFTELEFRTLGKRILGEDWTEQPNANQQTNLFGEVVSSPSTEHKTQTDAPTLFDVSQSAHLQNIDNTTHHYELIKDINDIKQLVNTLLSQQEICFDTETTALEIHQAKLVGLSIAYKPHHAYYIPLHPENDEATKQILTEFLPLFNSTEITWIGQNIKYDWLMLKKYGFEWKGQLFDTMLAHYVIEPEGKRSMDLLSEQYLQYSPISIETLIGKKGKLQGNMQDVAEEVIKDYAAEDADITLQLKHIFHPEVVQKQVEKVLYQVELPLVKVLVDMEFEGIAIDTQFLQQYSIELEHEAQLTQQKIFEQAGVKFNLASPKQLGEVLFEKLKLDDSAKKTKTGQYQTNEEILAKLAAKGHTICDDVLTFRELTKLKSTYVDALPALIQPSTNRIHTSYAQAVAVTGRLSSNNPNLQNIPIRTSKGKEIRKAFIPRNADFVLMSADYSQIELRIVAAISGDENMCMAFQSGLDIHTATAARVYKVEPEAVTKEMRYKAKSVNFGIIYGQGAFGLAENLGISRTEAKEIIDNYKREFPGITQYMQNSIQFAKTHGYVETLMGRKRWLKDIQSSNFTVRGFAERNAINSPIQGTAADMIKMAMINIHKAMQAQPLQSKMLLQVHDELIFDVHHSEIDLMKNLIVEQMQQALALPNDVPVLAEVGWGKNWLEAH